MHIAAEIGSKDVSEVLVQNGAKTSILNKMGLAPIHIAAKRGHVNIEKILFTIFF